MFFSWLLLFGCTLRLWDVCYAVRTWDYEPVIVNVSTADPNKLSIEAKVVRQGRDDLIASAKVKINYDMDETTFVEVKFFHSSTGAEDDYKPLPWNMPKQNAKEYNDNYYKQVVYPNVEKCSNMPKPENSIPFPRNTYIFDKCVIDGKGLPASVPAGYYKVIYTATGEVEWSMLGIIKVTTKTDMLG